MRPPRIMPPVYLLFGILAMIALHFLWPAEQVIVGRWRWLGAAPIAGGVVLVLWVARIFHQRKTTIKPGDVSTSLVTDGPFRLSRNPIYVGMSLVLIGTAIALGSLSPWLVLPVFVVIITLLIIPVEESMLREAFGEQYAQYQSRVRRWI